MRFLRVSEVVPMVGFSKNTLYARIRAGTFPKPIALGPQTTAFLEEEVLEWMKTQVAVARGYSGSANIPVSSARTQEGSNV
ncbi:helix-turn-helix transcriptional regulator [Bradyrhizobium sp. McL0616]|uniref:helix-turn-helix transcriptional regulator n=1 Tax=Bradyrhizobium sp. McL0616 TaxID=3415674 RepID=UPI003CF4AC14